VAAVAVAVVDGGMEVLLFLDGCSSIKEGTIN